MTSWMIFSCASDSVRKPIRFAGTCRKYSNSAIPQLTIAATYHGLSARLRRCAYHANVMNTFAAMSRRTVGSAADMPRFYLLSARGADGPVRLVQPAPRALVVADRNVIPHFDHSGRSLDNGKRLVLGYGGVDGATDRHDFLIRVHVEVIAA